MLPASKRLRIVQVHVDFLDPATNRWEYCAVSKCCIAAAVASAWQSLTELGKVWQSMEELCAACERYACILRM